MFRIIFKVAIREMRGALTRSVLTMLGVIIGVASVVAMVALGEGAKSDVVKKMQNLGTNLIIVRPGLMESRHVRREPAQTLTLADAEIIKKRTPHVVCVAPSTSQSAQVKYFNKNTSTTVFGVTPDYITARGFSVKDGKFFTNADIAGSRRVAALGKDVSEKLFDKLSPVGKIVKINGVNFVVLAVMEEKGEMGWWNADDQIMIPVSTFQKRLFGGKYVREISIEVENEGVMDDAKDTVTSILRKTHRITKGRDDDFNVRTQVEIIKSMEDITKTFTLLLGGIAAISLVVGGIGIMNIMLVTVTERTREIGLRKALGARKKDILKQFLIESTTLSGVGGLMGLALGFGVAWLIGEFSEWVTYVSLKTVMTAYSVALFVGVFFGWYPAWKAAKLNPVDALRRE
jgi:putative ABC transport system permease protein